jgi:hypothetical protein
MVRVFDATIDRIASNFEADRLGYISIKHIVANQLAQ